MAFTPTAHSAQAEVKRIIAEVPYMNLATVSTDGHPWNTPVYVAFDERWNFYWISSHLAQHSKNIDTNHRVFGVIYDVTRKHGTLGVYLQGRARALSRQPEVTRALGVFYNRKGRPLKSALNFLGSSPRRLYVFTPTSCWINTYTKSKGFWVDGRLAVNLRTR